MGHDVYVEGAQPQLLRKLEVYHPYLVVLTLGKSAEVRRDERRRMSYIGGLKQEIALQRRDKLVVVLVPKANDWPNVQDHFRSELFELVGYRKASDQLVLP